MSNDEARTSTFEQEQQPSNKSGKVNFRTWVIFFISIFTLAAACFYSFLEVRSSSAAHHILSNTKAAAEGADMIALELGDKSSITAFIFSQMKGKAIASFPKADAMAGFIGTTGITEEGQIYTCTGGAQWKAFLAKPDKDTFNKAFNKRFITRGGDKEAQDLTKAPTTPPTTGAA